MNFPISMSLGAALATIAALETESRNRKVAEMDGGFVPPLDTYRPKLYIAKRNDPCPCGSGKKYKRCCIDKTV